MGFNFSDLSVLVIGDIMLDRYVSGKVFRVSPEAPVPVVEKERDWHVLGGAANVASNVRSLGAHCKLCGVVGVDEEAGFLRSLLHVEDIHFHLFTTDKNTTTKMRVLGNDQQIVRVDKDLFFDWNNISQSKQEKYMNEVLSNISCHNIVVLSDYGKGFLSDFFCIRIIEECKKQNIPVIVDPKDGDWKKYSGVACIKPNLFELAKQTGIENIHLFSCSELKKICLELLSTYHFSNIFLTRGAEGALLVQEDFGVFVFPAKKVDVSDVSGAGDTACAVLATCFAQGLPLSVAGYFATIAASIATTKKGTQTVKWAEIELETE